MERWKKCVAVVTGASSGIGSAVVRDLVMAGFTVAGLARRKELIEELRNKLPKDKQEQLHPMFCDVTDLKSVNETFDCIIEKLGGVDVLVNNAGTLLPGQLLTMDPKKVAQVVNTNILGVVYCTQRAFKSMTDRKFDGHIFVINSVLGHAIMAAPENILPDHNIYPPTKYCITAMNEIYRQELRALKTQIKITSISPGVTDTAILPATLNDMCKLRPEDISNGIMYAISTPPSVRVHELTIKHVAENF